MNDGIVIAGGGLAAQRAAETLRRLDYCGPMRMIAAEAHLPYDRPPLSKELLSGERDHGEIAFRLADWYAQHDVDLMLGVAATSLCPGEHKLGLSDGSLLRCNRLLIATGSRPRRLPLLEPYENVHELRTVDDARALRKALRPGTRLVVIGAGFIGMEVAATARRLGAEVTLVEAASNPLAQILGDRLGGWFADLHRAEGVRVLTHRQVTDALGKRTARWLRLSDDTVIEADLVLVAIGVQPDAAWLAGTPQAPRHTGRRPRTNGRAGRVCRCSSTDRGRCRQSESNWAHPPTQHELHPRNRPRRLLGSWRLRDDRTRGIRAR